MKYLFLSLLIIIFFISCDTTNSTNKVLNAAIQGRWYVSQILTDNGVTTTIDSCNEETADILYFFDSESLTVHMSWNQENPQKYYYSCDDSSFTISNTNISNKTYDVLEFSDQLIKFIRNENNYANKYTIKPYTKDEIFAIKRNTTSGCSWNLYESLKD